MFRYAVGSFLVICAFAGSAWAEKIGLPKNGALLTSGLSLDVSDPLVQAAVIAAAPADWRASSGADVWWASINGFDVHVQVFPTLSRPGNGNPQCCLSFVQGDTEFWLKVHGSLGGGLPPGGLTPGGLPPGSNPPTSGPWQWRTRPEWRCSG